MKANRANDDAGRLAREGRVPRLRVGRTLAAIVTFAAVVAASEITVAQELQPAEGKWVAETLFPDLSGQELTFMGNGGEVQNQQYEALMKEFSEKTGLKINFSNPVNFTKIQAQVESGTITDDIVNTQNSVTVPNCGVLWEKTPDINRSLLLPNAVQDECAVPIGIVAYVLPYNKNMFPNAAPSGWDDYFNLEKFPGKRGMWSSMNASPFEIALLADGVAPEDLYPIDFDRALAKWKTLRDQLVIYDNLGISVEQMAAEGVAMLVTTGNRAIFALRDGAPYGVDWTQPVATLASFSITMGSKHLEAAKALLQYMATPGPQQHYAVLNGVGPVAIGAELPTDPLYRANNPALPENLKGAVFQDAGFWTKEQFDKAAELWANFLAGG
jgi:putative spermidine/putrescine transport system substrate-binding protein